MYFDTQKMVPATSTTPKSLGRYTFVIQIVLIVVKNLASFNGQNKKVESSAEIYRDQSLV